MPVVTSSGISFPPPAVTSPHTLEPPSQHHQGFPGCDVTERPPGCDVTAFSAAVTSFGGGCVCSPAPFPPAAAVTSSQLPALTSGPFPGSDLTPGEPLRAPLRPSPPITALAPPPPAPEPRCDWPRLRLPSPPAPEVPPAGGQGQWRRPAAAAAPSGSPELRTLTSDPRDVMRLPWALALGRGLLGGPQECGLQILEQMERYGVVPDAETRFLLLGVFGPRSRPVRKAQRMLYWLPRLRHINPHPLPPRLPPPGVPTACLALRRIAADPGAAITVYQQAEEGSEEGAGQPYIVGAQSPEQREQLAQYGPGRAVVVEGPFPLWLRSTRLSYFLLRGDPLPPHLRDPPPDPERSLYYPLQLDLDLERGPWDDEEFDVDEVEEGPVFALCMAGAGDRRTLGRWIAALQETNPVLGATPVVFRLATEEPPPGGTPPPLGDPSPALPPGSRTSALDSPKPSQPEPGVPPPAASSAGE